MTDTIVKGGRQLRRGYTTGSCASAAAAAATHMLLTQEYIDQIPVTLPQGERVFFRIEDAQCSLKRASCSVKKDAGDDPDATDGLHIFATCARTPSGIRVSGGSGIGVVVADGLFVPKGEAAINPIPKKMIAANVAHICAQQAYTGGVDVSISAPGGEAIALKTFNPRLGIQGGISILGTTGRVEPMSEKAVVDTIKLLIDKQYLVDAENILITPGNYGSAFSARVLGIGPERAVQYANFLGESLDYIAYKKFKRILLVGHLGKMVKAAGGIMDTHSAVADCRMEILTAHAACAGANAATAQALMECKTTDAAVALLREQQLDQAVHASMLEKILFHLQYRLKGGPHIAVIVFSQDDMVMKSAGADELVRLLSGRKL